MTQTPGRSRPGSPRDQERIVVGPLTLTVGLVTLLVSTLGMTTPSVLAALQRRPGELADGQVWRLVSSLLVHDSWVAMGGNLIALVVIGGAAERQIRSVHWAVLYLIGGVTGQLVGLAWQPVGAGNSVAILGVLGGLVVFTLRGRADAMTAVALTYGTILLVALAAVHTGGGAVASALVASTFGAVGVFLARRRIAHGAPPLPARTIAVTTLGVALALVVLRDIHGPALLVGVATAFLRR